MTPRTAGLLLAAALATGWLMGSNATQEAADAAARRVPPGIRPVGSPPAPYTQRLRERMKQQPPTPERGRNPFSYGSRTLPPAPAARRRADATAPEPLPAPEPPRAPRFQLSGIAANQENGVTVFTAIVIDNGVMVFAKAGDTLSNGYTVVRVEEMSITLADAAGVTETLRLP